MELVWHFVKDGHADTIRASDIALCAPELGGEWGRLPSNDPFAVISLMREACLSGLSLLSDLQPAKLRVDDYTSGPPHIWLHEEKPDSAWIVVDIGALDWCKLSYQFGHELCNSWQPQAKPKLPSSAFPKFESFEAAFVEPVGPCLDRWSRLVSSISAMMRCLQFHGIDELANVGGSAGRGLFDPWCGLGLLADSWEHRPPFPNDAAFASNIREYRQDLIEKYRTPAGEPRQLDMCVWLRRNRDALDHTGGVGTIEGPEILQIVAGLEGDKACVEDLGAVNRWPARSEVPVEEYLRLWQTSCAEIGAPGQLPARLAKSVRAG